MHRVNSYRELIVQMSPKLRAKVALHCCRKLLDSVYYFQGAPEEFLVELVQLLHASIFVPGEVLDAYDTVFMLTRGVACKEGRVMVSGAVWGEDLILSCDELIDHAAVLALTFVEVYALTKQALFSILPFFPDVEKRIRVAACRMAVRRGIMRMAKERVRQMRQAHGRVGQRPKISPGGKMLKTLGMSSRSAFFEAGHHMNNNPSIFHRAAATNPGNSEKSIPILEHASSSASISRLSCENRISEAKVSTATNVAMTSTSTLELGNAQQPEERVQNHQHTLNTLRGELHNLELQMHSQNKRLEGKVDRLLEHIMQGTHVTVGAPPTPPTVLKD